MLHHIPFRTAFSFAVCSVGRWIRPRRAALLTGIVLAIAAAAAPSRAQPVGGRKVAHERVLAHSTDVYQIRLVGGERTRIIVDGDGDTDLDLFIYDEFNNLVASDVDDTDYCVCDITPKWTGPFTIRIRNWGSVYNRYLLTAE